MADEKGKEEDHRLLAELAEAICHGDSEQSKLIAERLLSEGVPPQEIVVDGLSKGLIILGKLWESGEVFLADILISVDAFNSTFELIRPRLKGSGSESLGKIVIGTVKGDIHYVGKNIVGTLLEAAGFDVIDLGEDVSASQFCDAVASEKPSILALSCLVSTSLHEMNNVIEELKMRGLRENVKVMVGGPPITPEFAKKIGADLYAPDGFKAITMAKEALALK